MPQEGHFYLMLHSWLQLTQWRLLHVTMPNSLSAGPKKTQTGSRTYSKTNMSPAAHYETYRPMFSGRYSRKTSLRYTSVRLTRQQNPSGNLQHTATTQYSRLTSCKLDWPQPLAFTNTTNAHTQQRHATRIATDRRKWSHLHLLHEKCNTCVYSYRAHTSQNSYNRGAQIRRQDDLLHVYRPSNRIDTAVYLGQLATVPYVIRNVRYVCMVATSSDGKATPRCHTVTTMHSLFLLTSSSSSSARLPTLGDSDSISLSETPTRTNAEKLKRAWWEKGRHERVHLHAPNTFGSNTSLSPWATVSERYYPIEWPVDISPGRRFRRERPSSSSAGSPLYMVVLPLKRHSDKLPWLSSHSQMLRLRYHINKNEILSIRVSRRLYLTVPDNR